MIPLLLYDGNGKVVATSVVEDTIWQIDTQTMLIANNAPVVVEYLGAEAEIIVAYEVKGMGFVVCPSQVYVSPGATITFQKGALVFSNYPHPVSGKPDPFMYTADGQPYI